MAIQDIWLSNLKALVTREGSGRKGLRAVADLSGLSEEYVYQLVEGKPKKDGTPREVGKTAAKKIAKAFAEGRPESWFDAISPEENPAHRNPANTSNERRQADAPHEATLAQTLERLVTALATVDAGTRETIASLTHEAICKPEKALANIAAIDALMRFATGKVETAAFKVHQT